MLFSRAVEVEVEDLRIGRLRIRVQENILDRMIGAISPAWKLSRLRARAALDGGAPSSRPSRGLRVIHRGISSPPKDGIDAYGGGRGTFDRLVDGYQAGNRCSRGAAIRAVAADHPEAHEKYVQGLHG